MNKSVFSFGVLFFVVSIARVVCACTRDDLVVQSPYGNYDGWKCGSTIQFYDVNLPSTWTNEIGTAGSNWVVFPAKVRLAAGYGQGNAAFVPLQSIPTGQDSVGAFFEVGHSFT